MTERFTLTFDDKIVDNKLNITHDVHSGYTVASNFAKMLNEFDKENRQLTKDNQTLLKHCETHKIIVPLDYNRYKQYIEDK